MEIAHLDVIPIAHREPPLRNSWGIHNDIEARTIVRVRTADGATGISETYGEDAVIAQLRRARDWVEGMDAYDQKELELRLQHGRADNDVAGHAVGAIEVALLDLIGRETGRPLYDLLGGKVRDEVPFSAYLFFKEADENPERAAITPDRVMTPRAMVNEAREFVDRHGFEVLKLKGGVLEPAEELDCLRLLGEEFGSETPLRIDPNGMWSVETATWMARQLEASDLTVQFLEDPVPTVGAHARLKRHTDLPVATNMFVTAFDHVSPAVDADAVDVILSDHHYWGGARSSAELDRVARTFDLSLGMHSNSHLGVSMAAMVQIAAAMPSLRYACDTHYPWEPDDVIENAPVEISDGTIDVPDAPGLGVRIDEARLDQLHERYLEHEPERDDTASMSERDQGWVPNKPRW